MILRFLRWLFGPSQKPAALPAPTVPARRQTWFTSDAVDDDGVMTRAQVVQAVQRRAFPVLPHRDFRVYAQDGTATDANDLSSSAKFAFSFADAFIPDAQALWYASQGFIGFQMCTIIAQHWLVDKACTIPARDAMRNGYRITGAGANKDALEALKEADARFGVKNQCVQLVKMCRVFGIRIALFKIETADPKTFYERPFNPDGITPGSYRGIVQVDPYWCIPELSVEGASNPASSEFYEPTYWTIQGVRYHKSHLIIIRGPEVPDILKPSYQYAGLPLTQRIYERVYAAERTANEGPQLALSKRSMVYYTDAAEALANQGKFESRLSIWARFRDNFGVKVADKEGDKVEQHETSLGDFDSVVMTQYQLVAAIANVPATKLLGTTPKGFNATGEYEEANYHEELESIQANDAAPLIRRHHICVIRSELAPRGLVAPTFTPTIEWNPLDAPTQKEEAEVQKLKAETDKVLVEAGALDGQDVRNRVRADAASGYSGIVDAVPPDAGMHLPGGAGAQPAAQDGVALDADEFDPVAGTYAGAILITNQEYLDDAIVAAKIVAGDFDVQLSPEFVTPSGKRYRVLIDGHHSLAAAVRSNNMPVFTEANYEGSDYVNAITHLPVFGQELQL